MSQEYVTDGRRFRFNDLVCVEMLLGVPDEERSGRLVQVRQGCGQFGSDLWLIRLRNGSLKSFENALLRHADDRAFEEAFYRSNGRTPPVIPNQPPSSLDTEFTTYTIRDRWPEKGFLVERPQQPQTPGSFTLAVTRVAPDETVEAKA